MPDSASDTPVVTDGEASDTPVDTIGEAPATDRPRTPAEAADEGPAAGPPRHSWNASRHSELVLGAEVRRLVRELDPLGPMPRAMLSRKCRASHWREGSFEAAVQEGLRSGALRRLPFGFIDVRRGVERRTGG